MKRMMAALLCASVVMSHVCVPVYADDSSEMDEWISYAQERFEQYTIPDDVVRSFLDQVAENPEFDGMTSDQLTDWLQREVLLKLDDPDLDEAGILNILSEAAGTEITDSDQDKSGGPSGKLFADYGPELESHLDITAYDHIMNDGIDQEEYLQYCAWLVDYVKNVIEPQAVEKLLQIPAFEEGASEGLLSTYMGLALTYDPETGYNAMVAGSVLDADKNANQSLEEPVCNQGTTLLVNLSENGPETRTDDEKLRDLEDTILHEMTHAFMRDLNRNGMIGTDKDGLRPLRTNEDGTPALDYNGDEVGLNRFPLWFIEGTATSVQAGYYCRHGEMMDYFEARDDRDLFLRTLEDRDEMIRRLQSFLEGRNSADLIDYQNAYCLGYVACMYLYSAAAENMGLSVWQTLDDGEYLNEEALLSGMSGILLELKDGKCLDEIIAEYCRDPESGEAFYDDTAAFEEKFCQSADDPGLIFWQKMMTCYEKGYEDPENFAVSGSILPGYENALAHYLTDEVQDAPAVYQIVTNPEVDMDHLNFPISTVQPSRLALGGGKSISYDPEADALGDDETAERDAAYIGDEIEFVSVDD